jgi:hypothetical protein
VLERRVGSRIGVLQIEYALLHAGNCLMK